MRDKIQTPVCGREGEKNRKIKNLLTLDPYLGGQKKKIRVCIKKIIRYSKKIHVCVSAVCVHGVCMCVYINVCVKGRKTKAR